MVAGVEHMSLKRISNLLSYCNEALQEMCHTHIHTTDKRSTYKEITTKSLANTTGIKSIVQGIQGLAALYVYENS